MTPTTARSKVGDGASVAAISSREANRIVVAEHYLHRKTNISHAFGLTVGGVVVGVVTFGTPPSRHLQVGACPSAPSLVIELNRLWVCDSMQRNTESWFVARAVRLLPPRIIVSYADTKAGHVGHVYRALNFKYAGWTDMDRKTPRYDYVVEGKHSRDAFRLGGDSPRFARKVRRVPKVKYWTVSGDRRDRARLVALCGWPCLSWSSTPPPPALPPIALTSGVVGA